MSHNSVGWKTVRRLELDECYYMVDAVCSWSGTDQVDPVLSFGPLQPVTADITAADHRHTDSVCRLSVAFVVFGE